MPDEAGLALGRHSDLGALVLAGGRSRRMGLPKATLAWGATTLLDVVVAQATLWTQEVWVVGGTVFKEGAARHTEDEVAGQGPLGGLISGLARCGATWTLVLACDLPLIRPEVVELLLARRNPAVAAVVPRVLGRPQALLAMYATQTALAMARECLSQGERSMQSFLSRLHVEWVEEPELRVADPQLHSFTNLNTPEAYQHALDVASKTNAN